MTNRQMLLSITLRIFIVCLEFHLAFNDKRKLFRLAAASATSGSLYYHSFWKKINPKVRLNQIINEQCIKEIKFNIEVGYFNYK